ncbi:MULTISPECIES: hypothetical protein [Pseudomonas]|uniref:Uncharacterized protein n=1 Tax=Pseudomonas auratipiscis TaxID=3115853 RepID=A0AB35WQQ2_9PSED|nr:MULTISPECIES: hypothetical protein [unclassified Pseudomonas]MEE1866903.1 hypothetical protein [Pseudomonas sp. 120P]MEE1960601.1 hypothetical protein [Pseudomonas sp. 119P]
MHPAMQQRVDGLAALRERSVLVTADFYAKIGRPAPAQQIRYQVVTKAKAYHIVELATGKTKGFCFSYRAAVNFAQALEAAATRKLVGRQ